MAIHWHRRDLRATDNTGLAAAAATGRVVPVFVLDPDLLAYAGPPRGEFMLDALRALRSWYRDRGGDLVIRHGDPARVLPALARDRDESHVTWNRGYSGLARDRDDRVRSGLEADGVEVATFPDALLYEPGSITTGEGTAYQVFSYFHRKWRDREPPGSRTAPAAGEVAGGSDPGDLPTMAALGVDSPAADVPAAGMSAARDRLDEFLDAPIHRYATDRDYPARDGTSGLSPHLKWGTIGIRAVVEGVDAARAAATDDDAAAGVDAFREQLAWRDFYAHVLAAHPRVVTENFREFERPIAWRTDQAGLRAWKEGRTGYPFVDAGMRQLRAEATMHNRVRMVVASFLTKDLLVDWREGYAWFRERLVDHDAANDAGGWQWAAGTGTDAQPYFRVFNPATQGERYDPDAAYIREYVPELRDAGTAAIHAWPDLDEERREAAAPAYPAPIVEHATRREAAIEMFEDARGSG